ncbi:MAG: 1-acyl-sn-glycerol-3-phosphate acyltransferase [Ruminococcaceae bacterium]|nr:1-acyl-sn-glycerol-3-phosphate acyltransferase [Oscillospiraceae bacterium]
MFLTILFLLSSITYSLAVVFGAQISPWWLFALIPGFFLGCILVYMLCISIISLFLPRKDPKKSSAFCRLNIRLFLDWLMCLLHVRFRITGEEILPEEPFVLISNHRSVFDPMVVLAKTKRKKMLFISKESNFKIPIAGPFIRHAAFLGIDRENGIRALRTLKNAADRMTNEDADIGIYPEGTRTKDGNLMEFKSGAFYLAKKANAPIVVMVVRNTEKVGKRFSLKPTRVSMDYVAVVDKQTVAEKSMDELALLTHDIVEAAWNKQ